MILIGNNREKGAIANQKKYGIHPAIKIADANTGGGKGFNTYPLYYLGFLPQKPKTTIIEMVDVQNIKVPE